MRGTLNCPLVANRRPQASPPPDIAGASPATLSFRPPGARPRQSWHPHWSGPVSREVKCREANKGGSVQLHREVKCSQNTRRQTCHFHRASDDTLQDLGVHESAADRFLRQLDKVGERVLVKDERKGGLGLCGRRRRMLDQRRGDGEEGPERDLFNVQRKVSSAAGKRKQQGDGKAAAPWT